MDKYTAARDIGDEFLAQVGGWIDATGEVLVLLRYLRAAGRKDFALCRSPADFGRLVSDAPVGTDIIAFRDAKLPIRGTVDESFMRTLMAAVPDGQEWLVLSLETHGDTPLSESAEFDDSHAGLRESLTGDFWGKEAAGGPCPNWIKEDDDTLVSRSKGGIDGPR